MDGVELAISADHDRLRRRINHRGGWVTAGAAGATVALVALVAGGLGVALYAAALVSVVGAFGTVLVGFRAAKELRVPATLTASGITLKAFNIEYYDMHVPWFQVRQLWLDHYGEQSRLLIDVYDLGALVGHDDRSLETLRRAEARHGAPLFIALRGSAVTDEELHEAVVRFSGGTVRIDA